MTKPDIRALTISFLIGSLTACSAGSGAGPSLPANPTMTVRTVAGSTTAFGPASSATRRRTLSFDRVGRPIVLPSVSGMRESITLPPNDAPRKARLEVTVLTSLPSRIEPVPARRGHPLMAFTLSTSVDVHMQRMPKFDVRPISKPVDALHAWIFNTQTGWRDLGPIEATGNRLDFGGDSKRLTLRANALYTVIPFSAAPAVSVTKLYVTNSTVSQETPPILTYTTGGARISQGGFVGLNYGVFGIAYDATPKLFFVTDFGNLIVFGRNRNAIGGLTGETVYGLAVDSGLHRLYAAADTRPLKAYRYTPTGLIGRISTSGGFQIPPSSVYLNVAVDSANHHVFLPIVTETNGVVTSSTIAAYDQNGNILKTSGGFPNLAFPTALVVDPFTQRLYVANGGYGSLPSSVTVYDEDGNEVPTAGKFQGVSTPDAITFDPSTRLFYVANEGHGHGGSITVYDEEGNPIQCGTDFFSVPHPIGMVLAP